MKKVLLALSMMASTVGFAQHIQPADLKVDANEVQQIQELISNKKMSTINKKATAGGQITNAFMSYADTIYSLYGGSTVFNIYQNPIYLDSTLMQEFTNDTSFLNTHAVGTTYDPTSVIWGDNQFSEFDSYTVDSVYILGAYRTPSAIPNPTGDSLIVELVWAPKSNATTFRSNTVTYTGGSPDNSCDYVTPMLTLSGGSNFTLSGTNKTRVGIELDANDTINTGSAWYGVEINQLIPAGNIVGFTWYFKSAYAAQTTTGDIYFSTVDPGAVAIPNFAGRLSQDPTISLSNLNMYFCDSKTFGGDNITSTAYSEDIYLPASTASWMFPETFNGNFTGIMVSGLSTVSIDEAPEVANAFDVYPNPSNGDITLKIAQGGAYTLEVVNMVGQVVYAESINVNGNEEVKRDLSKLAKGVYLLNVSGDNFAKTSKLTIK